MNQVPGQPPAGNATARINFFGLKIARDTDILAAAAFVISIVGIVYQIIYQVYGFYQGPEVVQFPPEQILFFSEVGNGVYCLHAGAQLSYANKGREGFTTVLKRARMTFSLTGKPYEIDWQDFEQFGNDGPRLTRGETRESAAPIVIKAGEVVSKETHFAPRTLLVTGQGQSTDAYANYLAWDKFVGELGKLKELDIVITSEFYGLKDQQVKVFVRVNESLMAALKTDKWDSPSCRLRTSAQHSWLWDWVRPL